MFSTGPPRSSTATERPDASGKRGFDSHRERQFRRAVEFGLSAKRATASGFEPRAIRRLMDSQLAFCLSFHLISDGSQDWVIAHNDAVAGSSPAFGSRCRSSSVVEHVKFPVHLLSVVLFDGPKTSGYLSLVRIQSGAPDASVAKWYSKFPRRPLPISNFIAARAAMFNRNPQTGGSYGKPHP